MRGRLTILLLFLATILFPIYPAKTAHAENTVASKIIITEVKLGGDSYSQGKDQPKDPQEFVTLYNQSDADINLDGWALEYAKQTFDKTYCNSVSWAEHNLNSSANSTTLSGTLQPGKVSSPISRSLTDNTAGSIRLVDNSVANNPVIDDQVGWGDSAPCVETANAPTPSNGKSLKRFVECESGKPIDTNDNSKDFAGNQPPSPGLLNSPYITTCQESTNNLATTNEQSCDGILISELLPNPNGSDTGHEYIELYNPTGSVISLANCSLQTSGNSKVYNFGNVGTQPGEYHAFYSSETGLTLPNASGGTAWLLSSTTELQAIIYPGNLDNDVSWALISKTWHTSFHATPNAPNILQESKPCDAGQERNPDTGYCRNNVLSLTTSSLAACKAGYERNIITNRCRKISSAGSSSNLTPCKAGQVRNPQTNRCKATASLASANLKPCAAGQVRNPATNRCKKALTSGSTGKISDIASVNDNSSGPSIKDPHWLLAGFAVVGATSYGVYEWRQEVWQFLNKFKNKFTGSS